MLRLLRTRERFDRLIRSIPRDVLEEKTRVILDDYGKYYREFDDLQQIDFEPFFFWFKSFAHPKLSEESKEFYRVLLQKIEDPVAPELEAGLMQRLVAARAASELTDWLTKYQEGEEIDFGSALRETVDRFEQETNKKVKTPEVDDDVAEMLDADENDSGFHWRTPELNESMRPLRSGDFIIVAARPDVGKTTFNTSELSYMASQIDEVYPPLGPDGKPAPDGKPQERCIVWFNNEGPGNRIKMRFYQSALNATVSEMVAMKNEGSLHREYFEAIGQKVGTHQRIRIFNVHDFWNHEVEDIIRTLNPAGIVFDMIDNVKFGGTAGNNGQRTDQLLEAMYQWGRVLAVKYDCFVIANSQLSADAEGMQYPTLSMLKDSKTGKQGAADGIITIGYLPDYPNTRFLGMTKNKLHREGSPKSPKADVHFDGPRGRYVSKRSMEVSKEEAAVMENNAPTGAEGIV